MFQTSSEASDIVVSVNPILCPGVYSLDELEHLGQVMQLLKTAIENGHHGMGVDSLFGSCAANCGSVVSPGHCCVGPQAPIISSCQSRECHIAVPVGCPRHSRDRPSLRGRVWDAIWSRLRVVRRKQISRCSVSRLDSLHASNMLWCALCNISELPASTILPSALRASTARLSFVCNGHHDAKLSRSGIRLRRPDL